MSYTIHLGKENFKFSGTHFTVFGPETAERLHGHNYQVRVEIQILTVDPHLGMSFDFNLVKPLVKDLCDQLDEFILLPQNSPYVKIESDALSTRVQFAQKSYAFPTEDVRILPVSNLTSEELARFLAEKLHHELQSRIRFKSLAVTVEETRGQAVTYRLDS